MAHLAKHRGAWRALAAGALFLLAVPAVAEEPQAAGAADAQPAAETSTDDTDDNAGDAGTEGGAALLKKAEAKPPQPVDFEAVLAPLTQDRLFRASKVGLDVRSVSTGQSVFSREADRGLVPASTTKVVTAATALRTLGPAYRFTTDIYADGPVDQAGVLQGNLYVQGHGDPTLVVERLWKLVYDLKLEGINRVSGDVIFDEGYYDTTYQLPGWNKARDLAEGPSYFATSSALSLNFNTVAIVVAPGPEVGKPARVLLETPAGGYVTLDNKVLTGAVGASRRLDIDRAVTADKMTFTVEGTIASDDEARRYYRTVADPTAHFMAAWAEMEKVHGIEVKGTHRRGGTPVGATLLIQHRSVPLTAVLMDMNKYSNNFMAEQVLKAVGAETGGAPGSTAKGVAAVQSYLDELQIPRESYTVINGSGLSRQTSIPPSVLTAVMVDMANDDKVGSEFQTSLSIAGWDGTLWRRLREDPARVRGKTGTIDGVHCLTGYVTAADGELYAFSFLVNDLRGGSSQAKRLHDRFLRRMFNADQL